MGDLHQLRPARVIRDTIRMVSACKRDVVTSAKLFVDAIQADDEALVEFEELESAVKQLDQHEADLEDLFGGG